MNQRVVSMTPEEISDAPVNPNHMSEEKYAALVASVRKLGTVSQLPIVRAKPEGGYVMVDGHHRLRAAKEVGLTSLQCVVVDADADMGQALALSMNHLRGELNLSEAAKVVNDLDVRGWSLEDMGMTGFSTDEVMDLLKAANAGTDEILPRDVQVTMTETESSDGPRMFLLEVEFSRREDFQKAKRGLKRAAGKGKDLAHGLLRLLGES